MVSPGGGTTAVVMKTLEILDITAEFVSVDLCKQWYRDPNRPVGFVYSAFKDLCQGRSSHRLLLGNSVAGHLDDIQKDIDFVILDTMHMLPGELLDFLAVYPYLSKDSLIVMHDIGLNYRWLSDAKKASRAHHVIATKVLFSALKGIKYYNYDSVKPGNIAAVEITRETEECLRDIFFLLQLNWSYIPIPRIEKEYRALYEKYYDDMCMKIFDDAFQMEKKRYQLMKEKNQESSCFMNVDWAK